jgi:S-adenosyl methyltransferase
VPTPRCQTMYHLTSTRPRRDIARVYDAFLNGNDNYEIDRVVFPEGSAGSTGVRFTCVGQSAILIRVSRFIAGQAGVTQFLD